jgi:lipoate-protein ligase A
VTGARALRVLDTGLADARRNVALSAALIEAHGRGEIPDTLRLHRYRKCVLIGRSQEADAVLDRAACERRGAAIVRRVTGGGAVAMAPGILAWDLVAARRRWPSLEAVSASLGQAVAAALAGLGFAAAYRAPGEVAVAGRKVAGFAGAFEGPSLLHQGSLIVDADLGEMAELLGQPRLPVAALAEFGTLPAAAAIPAALGRAFTAAVASA